MMWSERHYRGPRSSLRERVEPPQANPNSSFLKDVDGEKFNARLAALFNHWVNNTRTRRESPLGQMMERQLGISTSSHSCIAMITDSVPRLEKALSRIDLDDAQGREYTHMILQFACGCGAEACAQWIADTYAASVDKVDMVCLIAASGNYDWLKRALKDKGFEEIPDAAYNYASLTDLDGLAVEVGFPTPPNPLK